MKRLITLILMTAIAGCALRPAPITTLNVRTAFAGLKGVQHAAKALEIKSQITERRASLVKKKKHFDIAIYATLWAPVALSGPIFLGQLPARIKTKAELKLMGEKSKTLEEIIREVSEGK